MFAKKEAIFSRCEMIGWIVQPTFEQYYARKICFRSVQLLH
jgi:hypothetical protein